MIWRYAALMMVISCGSDTVAPGNQGFSDFSEWGDGIEGFTGSAGVVDTGGSTNIITKYDGNYDGIYTLALSQNSGQYTCTYSNKVIQVTIESGVIKTPFPDVYEESCNWSVGGNQTLVTINQEFMLSGNVDDELNLLSENLHPDIVRLDI